jgi:SAM-dependent methyltransferase
VTFKDHFSTRAAQYAEYRPQYPAALFDFVANLPRHRRVALDCGAGNGQASVGLAERFDRVVATDPSIAQIENAIPHERIEYRVARAEASGLPSHTIDLVTAAQSLHWFDPAAFFEEAKRVLITDGAIAVWGYGDPVMETPALHQILHDFNRRTLGSYWFAERDILLNGYRDVPFPFEELPTPELHLEVHWTLDEVAGYLRTWSSTMRYIKAHGVDPVTDVVGALAAHWGDRSSARLIRWPLHIRAGRLKSD